MSEKNNKHREGKMPFWLIFLWLGFLAWIVTYVVVNLFKSGNTL